MWKLILKRRSGRGLASHTKKVIDEILSDGKKRTLVNIVDEIFERKGKLYATKHEITMYLNSNYNSENINNLDKDKQYWK